MRLIILLLATTFLLACTPLGDLERYVKTGKTSSQREVIEMASTVKYPDITLCEMTERVAPHYSNNGNIDAELREVERRQLNCKELLLALDEQRKEKDAELLRIKQKNIMEALATINQLNDLELCNRSLKNNGEWIGNRVMSPYKLLLIEIDKRNISHLDCQHLTGKYTNEMVAKFIKIETCNDYGFKDGTPDMGMCLLQLVTQEKTDQLIAATKSAEAATKSAEAASKSAEEATLRVETEQQEILKRVKNTESNSSRTARNVGVLSSDYYLKKGECISTSSDWFNC